MVHSVSGCTRGVQVKVLDPLRTRTTPERLMCSRRGAIQIHVYIYLYSNNRNFPFPVTIFTSSRRYSFQVIFDSTAALVACRWLLCTKTGNCVMIMYDVMYLRQVADCGENS